MNFNQAEERLRDAYNDYTGSSSNNGRVIAGALIGVGIGILAGILLAPTSGKETINKLSTTGNDWRNSLNQLLSKVTEVAGEYVQKGKTTVRQNSDLEV